jgi:hypothetical protein
MADSIGTDCPELTASLLKHALDTLSSAGFARRAKWHSASRGGPSLDDSAFSSFKAR